MFGSRKLDRRRFMQATAGLSALASLPWAARGWAEDALTPEMFGAKGDGQNDDSAAFAALSDHVNAAGGGTVKLRKTTYLVAAVSGSTSGPAKLMAFSKCTKPLVVRGNGATIRAGTGQRYGMFDLQGNAVDDLKHKKRQERGRKPEHERLIKMTPYRRMIEVSDCSGLVEISDIELDGRCNTIAKGGRHGDKGWQIPASGLELSNNTGSETVSNVYSHHHPQDGFYIDGPDSATPSAKRLLTGLKSEYNGRQGMSIVGGRDYRIEDSVFSHTGRAGISSAPGAGVDIEAERHKHIRNLSFSGCRFEDNQGCGLVADSGNSSDVRFKHCTFIGTTNWSAWPKKPKYRFDNCVFVGSIVNAYGNADPAKATQFTQCTFTDDPDKSPTGRVYLHNNVLAELAHAKNVLFDHCNFSCTHDGVLPWSVGPIYQDCSMSQVSTEKAHTRGTFRGSNNITGPVNISHSTVEGTLVINGKKIAPRSGKG